jgi:D-serine deaminase-like pyridoxal phosphate-dependent protein
VKGLAGASVLSFGSEEHISISLPTDSKLAVGDHLEIIPSHGCTTANLYREFILHRHGVVEGIWPIEGSGRLR